MRVLMVSRWFWEEHRRTGGGFVRELVEAVTASGIQLTILSQENEAGLVPEPRELSSLRIWVTSREKRRKTFFWADKLVKFWSGHRKAATDAASVLHMVKHHGPFDAIWAQTEEPDGLTCALAAMFGSCPPIVTQVQSLRFNLSHNKIRPQRRSSLGWVFRCSALVVANSNVTTFWLQKHYGIPLERIRRCRVHLTKDFRAGPEIVSREKRILFLGAINRNKAPEIFLKAVSQIAPELIGWRFVMIGGQTEQDEDLHKELQSLSEHPYLKDRVDWFGRVSGDAVRHEILRASLVVCPSRFETFSRTTVEALALDRPVIVTETTGAENWVRESAVGGVIPSGDHTALAHAIRDQIQKGSTLPSGFSKKIRLELTADKAAGELIQCFNEAAAKTTSAVKHHL